MSRRLDARTSLAAALIALGVGAALAWACGPFFPNRLLVSGDKAVLWAPVADFRIEIDRLKPAGKPPFHAVDPPDVDYRESAYARQTADTDRAELRAALDALKLPADRRDGLLAQHDVLRGVLRTHADQVAEYAWRRPNTAPPKLPEVAVPEGLPPEFTLYLRGAVAYYRNEPDAARQVWQDVLALPRDQRQYRSTWAAFMLGKSWLESDPAKAVECFQQTRSLAHDGFADSIGLASSSLGWEANAELKRDHVERAVDLYLQQAATDDQTAVWSLRLIAARVLKDGNQALRRAARDENVRRVVTAYLLANGGPRQSVEESPPVAVTQRWLEVVEAANVKDVAGADRLAWAAYQAGSLAAADRWLKLAPAQSGIGHWIRAKLMLRAGKADQAAAELALAARGFPRKEQWNDLNTDFADGWVNSELSPAGRVEGELGLLRLARRQYVEALDALLRGGYWMDAAYVAERVLTTDELLRYVEKNWPAASAAIEDATLPPIDKLGPRPGEDNDAYQHRVDEYWAGEDQRAELRKQGETNVHIRHLLARRLTRAERWAEAKTYFPRRYQAAFDAYARNLRLGRDHSQNKTVRAQALWEAARLSRYDGMELLGAELEPDWYAAEEGDFELATVSQVRDPHSQEKLTVSSADERERAKKNAVAPSKRWHYRYLAADLAWGAAELLPDESDETARVLCEAGSWLKARDPQVAERFYKALVRRCGKTELGSEAQRLHWFPKLPAHNANN